MQGTAQTDDRYMFIAEWYDEHSTLYKQFYMNYYFSDKSVELVSVIHIRS